MNLDASSENTLLFCYREPELVEKYKIIKGGSDIPVLFIKNIVIG